MTTATLPAPTRAMTADEFFDWVHRPENRDRCFELEAGEVIEMSRPGERHGFVCANVARILGNYTFERRRGYVLSNDTGLILARDPDTVRGPDVILYTTQRRFGELRPRYSDEMPALVVEVVSPNDRWPEITRRATRFLQQGVALVWVVDPETQTLTVYQVQELPKVSDGDDVWTCEAVLPGFRLRVGDLFFMPGEGEATTGSPEASEPSRT